MSEGIDGDLDLAIEVGGGGVQITSGAVARVSGGEIAIAVHVHQEGSAISHHRR